MLSFLHAGASSNSSSPAPFTELPEEPWRPVPNWNKGAGATGWYGKKARAWSVVLQLKLIPSTCDSSRAVGASCSNEWLHVRVYFYTFKGLGLSLPLKSVSVGGRLPALLEFQCEGAILALFIFIPLLEAGLHVEGWQSVSSLLDGESVFLGPVLWEDKAQRCGKSFLLPLRLFASLLFA